MSPEGAIETEKTVELPPGPDEDVVITFDETDAVPDGSAIASQAATTDGGPEGGTAPVPPSLPPPTAALEDIQRQLDQEREARLQAEQRERLAQQQAVEAVRIAQQAQRHGISVQEQAAGDALEAEKINYQTLLDGLKSAHTAGEIDRAVELQGKIGIAAAKIDRLEQTKAYLAQQREYAQRQPPPQVPQALPSGDKLAIYNAPTREFLRKHPNFTRHDGSLEPFARNAAEKAHSEGLELDTQAFFSRVEAILGMNGANGTPKPAENPQAAPPARGQITAAPVERSIQSSARKSEFRMTAKMRKLAREADMTDKDWAKSYLEKLAAGITQPITE